MLKEAAEAGFYKSADGTTYPKLLILTVQQILDGKQPAYPLHRVFSAEVRNLRSSCLGRPSNASLRWPGWLIRPSR